MYEYTKPRGPIAAMYSSPGPCYLLPGLVGQNTHDPRSVHNKSPAFPFGVRHGRFKDDCSPGPKYHPLSHIHRDGPDGTPHYSLYGRQKDCTPFKTPGAGSYSPEKAGQSTYGRAPQYSFGTRHRNRRTDNSPAPNCYSMPLMLGKTVQSTKRQAPSYSMTGRSNVGGFSEDSAKTPGPGAYKVVSPDITQNRKPFYSLTSRNMMPGDNTMKPGPGAHSPENSIKKYRACAYSFGIRHSPYVAPLIVDGSDVVDVPIKQEPLRKHGQYQAIDCGQLSM